MKSTIDIKAFVTNNRKNLSGKLESNSIAVINSNDVMPSNADGTMRYKPNNDLYWLTGITQVETTLILFPEHPEISMREILFIKQVDDLFIKWHGKQLSLEEAKENSGIENVKWQTEFENIFLSMVLYADTIYLNANEHPRSTNKVETRDARFAKWCKNKFPLHNYKRIAPIIAELRTVKSEYEIELIRKACHISGQGFRRILKFVKPGVKEKLIEAELIHEYMQHDGDWADYEPIIASGQNSCILHSNKNNNVCKDGDILLIDAAASYKLYNSDLTRTIPVNGRFTTRQKDIYNAVLKVHKAIKKFVKAGRSFKEIEEYSNELIIEQLIGLKLFTMKDLQEKGQMYYKDEYNYHPFGHYLGLDVHDVGNKYSKLPSNSVITVEPGIYIRKEKTGVRIENDVLVTENGIVDLMETIPVEPDEIESLMNEQ